MHSSQQFNLRMLVKNQDGLSEKVSKVFTLNKPRGLNGDQSYFNHVTLCEFEMSQGLFRLFIYSLKLW